jgi:putative addiction module CopG family antidote
MLDIHAAGRDIWFMQVTLSKELEAFIAEKVQNGGYADADEVVREALRDLKAKDDPAEADSQELAELLLAAVRGPHRPLTEEHFAQLRSRAQGQIGA